jgi:membrane protease YdiL (CAAX protease family)
VGEAASSVGLGDEPEWADDEDPFGIGEELARTTGQQRVPARSSVDFSDEHEAVAGRAVRSTQPQGVRVYSGVLDALNARHDDLGPVGEIFEQEAPSRARRAREAALRTHERVRARTTGERPVPLSSEGPAAPEGQRWGSDETAGAAVSQVLGLAGVAFLASLVVVLATDLGRAELDYSGNSLWFYGRGVLLIGLAVVGTVVVRREKVTSLGLRPPVLESVMGLGLGVVLGLLASLVAPVYLDGGASVGAAAVSMLFIALAHETFFRGFVTRALLVGMRNPASAILVSCLIYGFFYLSYTAVLGQSGFYLLYYSVLLYGFGLGGVFAVLYWKSRSIWPSVLLHSLVLVLAMLLAP